MDFKNIPRSAETSREVKTLIDVLHNTEQRLAELAGIEEGIDTNQTSRTILLRSAQDNFWHQEAIKQNAFVRVVFKTSNSGATWCYGLTKATTCDCTTANSCSLNDAERVVSNTQFKGIAATVSPNDSTFHFNPLRGTVNKGNVKFTSDGQSFQSRAVISGKGRITTCSDSGTGYMGAFKECEL